MAEKEKNKLHQLLAVEPDLRAQAMKLLNEAKGDTFKKKADHFDGFSRTYEPFEVAEGENPTRVAGEYKEIVTTVDEKLAFVQRALVKSIDAQISKEETNASGDAMAELVVGDQAFMLSATSLLQLEKDLTQVRDMYNSIPTLDPVYRWEDASGRAGVRQTPVQETFRTEKTPKVITLAQPTKEHPAQVQMVMHDKQTGVYKTVYQSGKLTPREKAERMARIDSLLRTVKKARAKANQAEVHNIKLGEVLFKYIDNK